MGRIGSTPTLRANRRRLAADAAWRCNEAREAFLAEAGIDSAEIRALFRQDDLAERRRRLTGDSNQSTRPKGAK
jgi:hypothetical protein